MWFGVCRDEKVETTNTYRLERERFRAFWIMKDNKTNKEKIDELKQKWSEQIHWNIKKRKFGDVKMKIKEEKIVSSVGQNKRNWQLTVGEWGFL